MKTHLVIHHSLTKDSGTVSAQAIRRYHLEVKGWRAIGYHLLVERINDRYEMIVGRPLTWSASAARERSMNHIGIHVCFIGNYDLGPPPAEMLAFALPHLGAICDLTGIQVDREHVIGHREVAPYKSCPGEKFDMDAFVRLLTGMG
jgi:hypothetical protein